MPVNHEVIYLAQIASIDYCNSSMPTQPMFVNQWNMEVIKRDLLVHSKNDLYITGSDEFTHDPLFNEYLRRAVDP